MSRWRPAAPPPASCSRCRRRRLQRAEPGRVDTASGLRPRRQLQCHGRPCGPWSGTAGTGRGQAAARRRAPGPAGDAGGLHPVGPVRRRHRRLPLLRARPAAHQDAFITGFDIMPGAKDVVHHVILFRVPPSSPRAVEAKDRAEKGEGWTCFGGTGVRAGPGSGRRAVAGRLGSRRRGAGARRRRRCPDARRVAGDHAGALQPAGRSAPGRHSAQLRLAPGQQAPRRRSSTMLLPAPVELPCRPGRDGGPLCDRQAAVADALKRFGATSGSAAERPAPAVRARKVGPVQPCDREGGAARTSARVAGHMHLLGRIDQDRREPGHAAGAHGPRHPGLGLRQPGRRPVEPMRLRRGDTVRVTCSHDQSLRDLLPAFEGQRSGTSCGARAPPTRCAWACCWSPGPDGTALRSVRSARTRAAASTQKVTREQHQPGDDLVGDLGRVERRRDRDHAGVVAPAVDTHPLRVRAGTGCAAGGPQARSSSTPESSGCVRLVVLRHRRPL